MERLKVANRSMLAAALLAGLVLAAPAQAEQPTSQLVVQVKHMHEFGTGLDVAGGGILTRDKNTIWASLSATGLEPGGTYTVWWAVFNNPENCAAGVGACAGGDLGTLAVNAANFWATGFIAENDGSANVTAQLAAGGIPAGVFILADADEKGVGLERGNGYRAEIHMVIRGHGQPIIGSVDDQIGTLNGGCPPNSCSNVQAIAFPPVDD